MRATSRRDAEANLTPARTGGELRTPGSLPAITSTPCAWRTSYPMLWSEIPALLGDDWGNEDTRELANNMMAEWSSAHLNRASVIICPWERDPDQRSANRFSGHRGRDRAVLTQSGWLVAAVLLGNPMRELAEVGQMR